MPNIIDYLIAQAMGLGYLLFMMASIAAGHYSEALMVGLAFSMFASSFNDYLSTASEYETVL